MKSGTRYLARRTKRGAIACTPGSGGRAGKAYEVIWVAAVPCNEAPSCGYFDKSRIVVAAAYPIDAPGHRLHANAPHRVSQGTVFPLSSTAGMRLDRLSQNFAFFHSLCRLASRATSAA